MDYQEFFVNVDYVFHVLFCNTIKVNYLLYSFIVLLHLIYSFSVTLTFLVPYALVSIESIDSVLLSSFELKTILLPSSVKTLSLSLLNIYCVFNIGLLLFKKSIWISLIQSL